MIVGPVRVVGPDGYRLETRDVTRRPRHAHHASAAGRHRVRCELGQFQAGRLSADLDERKIILDGGVRLKIVQGAVR